MKTSFGPWTTAIHSGANAQLSTFWKRRLALLHLTSQSNSAAGRSTIATLTVVALVVVMLPTLSGVRAIADEDQSSPAAQASLPRFKLQVGQELIYKGEFEFPANQTDRRINGYRMRTKWQIFVVSQNSDGSWRLIVRRGNENASIHRESGKAGEFGKEYVQFSVIDLYPNGRWVANSSNGDAIDFFEVFPRLPDTTADIESGWKASLDFDGLGEYQFVVGQAKQAGQWKCLAVASGLQGKLFGINYEREYEIDSSRQLPTAVVLKYRQTYGFIGKGTGKTQLADVIVREPRWTSQLSEDYQRFHQSKIQAEALWSSMQRNAKHADTLYAKIQQLWEECREEVRSPVITEMVNVVILRIKDDSRFSGAKTLATRLGTPAPQWEAADLQNNLHKSDDYQGRVVVYDFWYRGCMPCIKNMPQIKRLAAEFDKQPVTIVGMNTDKDVADAQFVAKTLDLNYTNLQAKDLVKPFQVPAHPTLFVVDQAGIIQDIHVGFSPTLFEDVSKSIRTLLRQ